MSAELQIVVRAEELTVARVVAFSFGDELRLAADLQSRPHLVAEVLDALEEAVAQLRARAAFAVPADANFRKAA